MTIGQATQMELFHFRTGRGAMMSHYKKAKRICKFCKKDFMAEQSAVNAGDAIYCSKSCRGKNQWPASSPDDIFENNIDKKENGCWEYRVIDSNGYGWLRVGGVRTGAHRYSYAKYVGLIPGEMLVCHSCDNRKCVNPDHLFTGTHKDNSDDMYSKNRQVKAIGARNKKTKLLAAQVVEIRELLDAGESLRSIGRKYDVTHQNIIDIKHNRTWKHLNNNKEEI